MISPKMEDYLKALYCLEREHDDPVGTKRLAEAVDVTPPTASSMLDTLESHGLVAREKYSGSTLTADGERVALEVIRHHRLLETFLADVLGYDWSAVHDEAEVLEHHISEEFERRVDTALGEPSVDPHGDPIPNPALDPIADDTTTALSGCEDGTTVEVARIRDRSAEELTYLEAAGITPGTELDIVERAPIGMLTVSTEEGDLSLPEDVTDAIRVRDVDATRGEQRGVA